MVYGNIDSADVRQQSERHLLRHPARTQLEVRSVAPDANPYLILYTILRTGLEGKKLSRDDGKRERLRFLPGNIYDALRLFKTSDYITKLLGDSNKEKYAGFKQASADRCPRELGTKIKPNEILYHHEVTNQYFWNNF